MCRLVVEVLTAGTRRVVTSLDRLIACLTLHMRISQVHRCSVSRSEVRCWRIATRGHEGEKATRKSFYAQSWKSSGIVRYSILVDIQPVARDRGPHLQRTSSMRMAVSSPIVAGKTAPRAPRQSEWLGSTRAGEFQSTALEMQRCQIYTATCTWQPWTSYQDVDMMPHLGCNALALILCASEVAWDREGQTLYMSECQL